MNREDIIRMARKAGAMFPADGSYHKFEFEGSLEHFAALVAAAAKAEEREACADLAENFVIDMDDEWVCGQVAKAIRARVNNDT